MRPEIAHCSASITSPPTDSPEASSAAPTVPGLPRVLNLGASAEDSMVALRTGRRPAMRTLLMATPPRISGLRPAELSIRNMLPSRTASSRLSAGPPGAAICAPDRSSVPLMRAPISLISPCERNSCSSRTAPPTRIRSAWRARSPWPSRTVSRQSSRPPISDSHSQTADRLDVLALVQCAPAMCDRDRSRSRRTRRPLPSRPGRRGDPVRASSKSCAPSTTGAVSNSHPSNRSENGTASPVRSSSPVTMALVSRSPRGSIRSLSSWQHLRSTAACTMRLRPSAIPSSAAPRCPALSSSASSISPMPRLSRDQRGRVYPGIGVLSRWWT
jgi:hypothetical protein